MCSMSVLCPLCAQTSFSSIDALRCSLIKAANGPLACPICHEPFLGLDKLTIHLFSHTNIMNSANNNTPSPIITKTTPTTTTMTANKTERATSTTTAATTTELLKTNDTETLSLLINDNCHHDTEIKQNFLNEVNCDKIHLKENGMVKKAKVVFKANENIVSKPNPTHQQVATIKDHVESKETDNSVTCDICEFTFRNKELRNMHMRLVHQNLTRLFNAQESSLDSKCAPITSTLNDGVTGDQTAAQEYDFKCHLCSKAFKMKGSLRVHLKVVHLMGLPYVNNMPKLSICDRIRYKENKAIKSSSPNNATVPVVSACEEFKPPTHLNYKNNNTFFNMQPSDFISNLTSLPNVSNLGVVNLSQPVGFQQSTTGNSTLPTSSNVVVVFNTHTSSGMAHNLNANSNNSVVSAHNKSNINTDPITSTVTLQTATDNDGSSNCTTATCSITENPKIWECDVCSKAFTTKYFLKKHKRLHTGEMPYTCELCGRTFTFQQSYHKHLLYHSDEKPHVCSTCGRAFKELSTLHNHERIHSGEKPFKCEVCGKSFRQRVSFLVHTRIHTGVMPYKCEICQRSFRYKVSQRTHKCQPVSAEKSPTHVEDYIIDHMSENFIRAFLETSVTDHPDLHLNESHNSPASNEIAVINEKSPTLNEQQAMLTKTIDDIVVESCNKMGIGRDGFAAEQIANDGSMSPIQKLENMRLYSPQLVTPDLNGIDGDLTRFFLENAQD